MFRLGIISEIGEGENLGYARVSFDENEIVSGWLAIPDRKSTRLNSSHANESRMPSSA